MSANDIVVVGERSDDISARLKPTVHDDIYMPSLGNGVLSAFNKVIGGGRGEKVGHQKQTMLHEHQFPRKIKVTAAASADASNPVTLTVDYSDLCRKNTTLFDPKNNQRLIVNALPTSATSVQVATLPYALSAGDELIRLADHAEESWDRSVPKGRIPESHDEYLFTAMLSTGISWHKKNTEYYGGGEEARVLKRLYDEFQNDLNAELLFGQEQDGSSNGLYMGKGLVFRGLENAHIDCVGGVLTSRMFDEMCAHMVDGSANGQARLSFHCSRDTKNLFARWPWLYPNLIQMGPNDNKFGSPKAVSPQTPIDGITFDSNPFKVDTCLSTTEESNKYLVVVNWANIVPKEFAQLQEQGPDASNPNGVADRGTGTTQWQLVRAPGMCSKYPIATVGIFTNVQRLAMS